MSFRYRLRACLGLAVAIVVLATTATITYQQRTRTATGYFRILEQSKGDAFIKERDPRVLDANLKVIDAKEFTAAYKENEIQAGQRYNSRLLAVRGVVSSIGGLGEHGMPYVVLEGADGGGSVVCVFRKDSESRIADVNPGSMAVVGGICMGRIENLIIVADSSFYEPPPGENPSES